MVIDKVISYISGMKRNGGLAVPDSEDHEGWFFYGAVSACVYFLKKDTKQAEAHLRLCMLAILRSNGYLKSNERLCLDDIVFTIRPNG